MVHSISLLQMLSEVEGNWEKDVVDMRAQAEAAAKERAKLMQRLEDSKQDLDHLTVEKRDLEACLTEYQSELREREQIVLGLRERLEQLEDLEDAAECSHNGEVVMLIWTIILRRHRSIDWLIVYRVIRWRIDR